MRKIIAALLLFCRCAAVWYLPAAAENHVPEMEIDVTLLRDGSAVITQAWKTDTDEGSEFYLSCRDSGYMSITDFTVSDESRTYILLELSPMSS